VTTNKNPGNKSFWEQIHSPAPKRSDGVTQSERYLKELCDRSFLSLWSYPGIFRDQGRLTDNSDGKEVSDLLVIFEEHIIIFSDKHCHFADSGDLETDWGRWYKRAVLKSAEQIWGAERWIRDFPNRLFLDRQCQVPFPIALPSLDHAQFHRIVVAHDGARRCREVLGGSGSLMLQSTLDGVDHFKQPFRIGHIDRKKGYVHVFDDRSLDVVMSTLDTVTDFVSYLTKKERLMTEHFPVFAAGEEELLAAYLSRFNADDEHDFIVDPDSPGFVLAEGLWSAFEVSPGRQAQVDANKISYVWDAILEGVFGQLAAGTYQSSAESLREHEKSFRWMARENRTRRRMLADNFIELLENTKPDFRASRVVTPTSVGEPYYLFLLLPHYPTWTREQYRRIRAKMLTDYCLVIKLQFPDALHVVGIAAESGVGDPDLPDLSHFDSVNWTPDLAEQAKSVKRDLGIFTDTKISTRIVEEFPLTRSRGSTSVARNSPCPCGSGKRYKRCCGSGMFPKQP
jgi:hypothetical protein